MANPLYEPALEILRATHDGDDLAPQHLALVQHAANGHLREKGRTAFDELLEQVRKGYQPPWFHGVENLTIDHYDYVLSRVGLDRERQACGREARRAVQVVGGGGNAGQ